MRHLFYGLLLLHTLALTPRAEAKFGDNGYLDLTHPSGRWWAAHLLRTHDNRYLVWGTPNSFKTSITMKIDDRGRLDSSFGDQGIMSLPFADESFFGFWAKSFVKEETGSFLVLGSVSYSQDPKLRFHDYVWRVLPNGSLDSAFGFREIHETAGYARNLVQTSEGYLIVTDLRLKYEPSGDFRVHHYDSQFNFIDTHKVDMHLYVTRRAVVGPNGFVFVTGYREDGQQGFVAKLHPNGTPVTNFGEEGVANLRRTGTVYGIDFAKDGKILVATSYYNKKDQPFAAVARLKPNGKLDRSFQAKGYQKVPGRLFLEHLQVTDDQTIVAAGFEKVHEDDEDLLTDAYVWKMDAEGNFDSSFGDNGIRRLDRFETETLEGLHVDRKGQITVVLDSSRGDGLPPQILRLRRDGSLDRS